MPDKKPRIHCLCTWLCARGAREGKVRSLCASYVLGRLRRGDRVRINMPVKYMGR